MMFSDRTPRPLPDAEPLIGTAEAAEALVDEVVTALGDLEAVIREETRLVRAGLLFAAADLEPEKTRASGVYLRLRTRLKANTVVLGRLCPERVRELRSHHQDFNALMRDNLAVLAIAREVSEDLVRTTSEAAGRHTAPRVYGRHAAPAVAPLTGARGIAIDRRL